MAKRQKSLQNHYFAKSRDLDYIDFSSSSSEGSRSPNKATHGVDHPPLFQAEFTRELWNELWVVQFQWLEFSAELGKVFCKVCREKGGRSVYAKEGSKNFKVSAFLDHG